MEQKAKKRKTCSTCLSKGSSDIKESPSPIFRISFHRENRKRNKKTGRSRAEIEEEEDEKKNE